MTCRVVRVGRNQAGVLAEPVTNDDIVLTHIIRRHQGILPDQWRETGRGNPPVGPGSAAVSRDSTIAVEQEVVRIPSAIIETNCDFAAFVRAHGWFELIGLRGCAFDVVVDAHRYGPGGAVIGRTREPDIGKTVHSCR